jgi:hypothetical protein
MARPSAGSRFAAHLTGGLIRAAGNTLERHDKLKLLKQEMKLREEELDWRQKKFELDQREMELRNLEMGVDNQRQDRALDLREQEMGYSKQFQERELGLKEKALEQKGVDERTPQEKVMDDLKEQRARQLLESGAIEMERKKKAMATADLSPEEKKAARYFPENPQDSPLFAPLMEAVQETYNSGSNPMHGDFYQKLFNAVEARLKQMEGTVTPEVVAKAAKYVTDNMDAFGSMKIEKKRQIFGFGAPADTSYAPPAQTTEKSIEDYAAELWGP